MPSSGLCKYYTHEAHTHMQLKHSRIKISKSFFKEKGNTADVTQCGKLAPYAFSLQYCKKNHQQREKGGTGDLNL